MKLIKEIYDTDLGIADGDYFGKKYKIRKAARTLLFNDKNQIAFLYVAKENYHKLPGGGVDEGEEMLDALKREVLEETGCSIKIIDDLGIILEYRNQFEQLQISYFYISKVYGEIKEPLFTEKEKEFGFELKWVSVDKAIELLKKDAPSRYVDKFMVIRDLSAIELAKKL